MSDTVRAVAQGPTTAEVVGYVEAVTETAALGWVWRPGSEEKMIVELRIGEQTLNQACADNLREDLARSGIGDGRHAFTLPIPDGMRSRSAELRVLVVRENDVVVELGAPPVTTPETSSGSLATLQRGVEMLVGSQRLIHRNLQAALLQQQPSFAPALAEIAAAQANLQESIATFELFAVRLEQALALREAPASGSPARLALAVVGSIASVALVGSCWALWRSMLG